jgi:hypothetical protein
MHTSILAIKSGDHAKAQNHNHVASRDMQQPSKEKHGAVGALSGQQGKTCMLHTPLPVCCCYCAAQGLAIDRP